MITIGLELNMLAVAVRNAELVTTSFLWGNYNTSLNVCRLQ